MIIYKITNRINGKVYIGQTIRPLALRWAQHCSPSSGCTALHMAILKYGKENFTVEQIDVACDRDELNSKEMYWIEQYDSIAPNGYNLSDGGDGCRGYKHTQEARRRLSRMRSGKPGTPHTDEWRRLASERQLGKKHPHAGRPMSAAQKQLLSDIRTGKPNPKKWKKVICLDTGMTFSSRKEAAKWLHTTPSAVTNAIKRGHRCGGFVLQYAG